MYADFAESVDFAENQSHKEFILEFIQSANPFHPENPRTGFGYKGRETVIIKERRNDGPQ